MRFFHESSTRRMTRAGLAALGMIALTFGVVRHGDAATSGTSDVVLNADATVEISIQTATLPLNPVQSDYENNYMALEGTDGIDVQVKTNSSTGMVLSVKCADAVPEIRLTDLWFRTQTTPGGAGTRIGNYTQITGSDQHLWTTTTNQETYTDVWTDIKVTNLWHYTDSGAGGTTAYTNTLTYTVTVQ